MFKITQETYDEVISHARLDFPIEACGYLAEKNGVVQKKYALENMDRSGIHFSFNPPDQFDAVRHMRSLGMTARAVYHSHPTTPARPSKEDIRLANDPNVSYVIISLLTEPPEMKSFVIKKGHVTPEEILIEKST